MNMKKSGLDEARNYRLTDGSRIYNVLAGSHDHALEVVAGSSWTSSHYDVAVSYQTGTAYSSARRFVVNACSYREAAEIAESIDRRPVAEMTVSLIGRGAIEVIGDQMVSTEGRR